MKAIIIFAKYPEPHKVKTRLGAQIGHTLAADLYRIFIEQTIALAAACSADRIFIAYEPKEHASEFQKILPVGVATFPQDGIDLGKRLLNAFQWTFSQGASRVVIIGSDSPTLPPQFIGSAFDSLQYSDIVIGPAVDGGYYLIGSKTAHPQLFENIEWSSTSVLEKTLERASELRLTYSLLSKWYDVDEIESLRRAVKDDPTGHIKNFLFKHSTPQLAQK